MNRIAQFEKVSQHQFVQDYLNCFPNESEEKAIDVYNKIKLPLRSTKGSAGYDIFAPIDIKLTPNQTLKFPTGIRVKINDGYFLAIVPRSGLGFKFALQLDNTIGIIDSDYYGSSNEGHMFIKMTNHSNENKVVQVLQGQGIAQGIFIPFGITFDDDCDGIRDGGFGSTTK